MVKSDEGVQKRLEELIGRDNLQWLEKVWCAGVQVAQKVQKDVRPVRTGDFEVYGYLKVA